MCESVTDRFKSMFVASGLRNHDSWWNPLTKEYVFRDEQYDSEDEWRKREVWDVCCLSRLVRAEDGHGMFGEYDYCPSNDYDIDIKAVARRIATEPGWEMV